MQNALIKDSDNFGAFSTIFQEKNYHLFQLSSRHESVMDFAVSVAKGLSSKPRQLESRFLYDETGSELYEDITIQPEYYPTRIENTILQKYAENIREITGLVTLFEFGSGSSVKTDHLFDSYLRLEGDLVYVPVDVSESALRLAQGKIKLKRPQLRIIGINGTYQEALPMLGCVSPVMVIFLGSSLGNFNEKEAESFLADICANLSKGDFFLLGLDLVKDISILEAAYNDAAGVTKSFTRNLFVRMNRELSCGIDITEVEHVAFYNEEEARIEIYARFNSDQVIHLSPLKQNIPIRAGERIQTEISRKFSIETYGPYLESFGLRLREVFTDENSWFGLMLLEKT